MRKSGVDPTLTYCAPISFRKRRSSSDGLAPAWAQSLMPGVVLVNGGAGRPGSEERGGSQRRKLMEFAAIGLCAHGDCQFILKDAGGGWREGTKNI